MIEINWVFTSGLRNRLDIRVEIEVELIEVMGLKVIWVFTCGVEIDVRIDWLVFCAGVKIRYLFLVFGSSLTWLCVRAWNDLFLVWGENDLSFCAGDWNCRNWLGFCMLAGHHLVLVRAWILTSLLRGWSKLTDFRCGGSNRTWFQLRHRNWLGFGVGVENHLVLVFGSKSNWF